MGPLIAAGAVAAKGIGMAGAAGISALGSIGSSIVGNIGARNSQNRANRQNIEFWNMQNKYNHPSSQMERLRSAGLNPNLVYAQGGGSQQVGDISAAKPAPFEMKNPMSEIGKYSELKSTEINNNNMKQIGTNLFEDMLLKRAQQENTAADTANKQAGTLNIFQQTAHNLAQTARSQFDLNFAKEIRDYSAQSALYGSKLAQQAYMEKNYGNMFLSQTLKNRVMQTTLDRQYKGLQNIGQDISNKVAGKNLGLYGDDSILNPSTPIVPRLIYSTAKKGYTMIKNALNDAGNSARDASKRQIERYKNK